MLKSNKHRIWNNQIFKMYIEKEKRGEITMEDAKRFLDKKYKMKENEDA